MIQCNKYTTKLKGNKPNNLVCVRLCGGGGVGVGVGGIFGSNSERQEKALGSMKPNSYLSIMLKKQSS
jgi:hypothetical protein